MNATTILALMALLVPPANQQHNGESEADATARYSVIADAIASEAGDDATLALYMVTISKHETHFKKAAHSGAEKGDGGWAWGLFQFNNRSHLPEMALRKNSKHQMLFFGKRRARQADIVGTSKRATKRAAVAAAFYLRPIVSGCRGAPMCVFRSYGGVDKKASPKVEARLRARVATYSGLVTKARAQK